MLIEILRQTSIAGRPARVGQVIEVNDSDASTLLAMRKARPAPQDLTPAAPEARPRPRKPRTPA